ncbi:MAG: NAD(P)/FAD-dependent oxidoreductase [Clostridia bacterium]|nr:NAD(P)/FAD-dependent oxidoreductase [Clostridia bacterium]
MFDAVIIGAGVVGGFVARALSRYDIKVCILEAKSDVAMGATKANSAIAHAGFDAKEGSLKAKLNVRGSEMMEEVCRDLGVKYSRCGSLVVGFSEEDKKTLDELLERGVRNGVKELSVLNRDELIKIEPNIGKDAKYALYAPTGAIVCPYELCVAAIGNAMDNGVSLKCNFAVSKIEKQDFGYRVYSESGDFVEASVVINCAGVYSDKIAAMVGDNSFTITPRRGEYMLLDKEAGAHVKHTIFRCPTKMGKGILVSPTVDGNLLLGPTAEDIEDKTATETTVTGLDKVKALACDQVDGIPLGKVITSFAGLRSVSSVGDFIINSPAPSFINVAGIESPGLTSAPAIGEYVKELIESLSLIPLKEKEGYNPKRRAAHWFSALTVDEKNEVIKAHPEYAHIICRCELITEGEILDAIRTNPRPADVDGVKRRTRATMGRCQGGFCSPYIVELLATEMGCAYEDVTKFGGGSIINVGKTKEV